MANIFSQNSICAAPPLSLAPLYIHYFPAYTSTHRVRVCVYFQTLLFLIIAFYFKKYLDKSSHQVKFPKNALDRFVAAATVERCQILYISPAYIGRSQMPTIFDFFFSSFSLTQCAQSEYKVIYGFYYYCNGLFRIKKKFQVYKKNIRSLDYLSSFISIYMNISWYELIYFPLRLLRPKGCAICCTCV